MTEVSAIDTSTPAGASAQLANLSSDKEWGAKLLAGDATALADFDKLSRTASGFYVPPANDAVAAKTLDAFAKSAVAGEPPVLQLKAMREAASDGKPPTPDELVAFSARQQHVALAQDLIADALTKFELNEDIQSEIVNGCKATPEQCAAAARLQNQKLNDPDFAARLLRSDPEALRTQFLLSFILSSDQAQGIPMKAIANLLGVGAGQPRNLSHPI
jgi:hypothetical protein